MWLLSAGSVDVSQVVTQSFFGFSRGDMEVTIFHLFVVMLMWPNRNQEPCPQTEIINNCELHGVEYPFNTGLYIEGNGVRCVTKQIQQNETEIYVGEWGCGYLDTFCNKIFDCPSEENVKTCSHSLYLERCHRYYHLCKCSSDGTWQRVCNNGEGLYYDNKSYKCENNVFKSEGAPDFVFPDKKLSRRKICTASSYSYCLSRNKVNKCRCSATGTADAEWTTE